MPRDKIDSDTIRFATGAAGGVIAYRPNEVLIETGAIAGGDVARAERLVNRALDPDLRVAWFATVRGVLHRLVEWLRSDRRDVEPEQRDSVLEELDDAVSALDDDPGDSAGAVPRLRADRSLNDRWHVFVPAEGGSIDPVQVSRVLRSAGFSAQPNYVRFINTLQSAPNYIAPNYIAPNYIAPNYIAPNYIAPNYIAPNYIAPNYIAGGHGGAGGCQCEPCPDAPHVEREVPMITARGAYGPMPGPDPTKLPPELEAEIHVLDVRFQSEQREDFTNEFDELKQAKGLAQADAKEDAIGDAQESFRKKIYMNWTAGDPLPTSGRSIALLPLLLRVLERARNGSDAELQLALDEFHVEPNSAGLGANVNGDQFVDPTTNHAEFIGGIIDRLVLSENGESIVRHHAIAGTLGDVDDADLSTSIDWVVKNHPVDGKLRIMNLSLSGYTDDDAPDPVLAQSIAAAQESGWLIIASAGNNGSCRLAWPAALNDVVSVAAYGPCGPAYFSNYGPWVDACGPGVDVVSKFNNRPEDAVQGLKVAEKPEDFIVSRVFPASQDGDVYASWSGTSFSAPYVAAMIAARVAKTEGTIPQRVEKAQKAMITDPDLIRYPGYGTIVSSEAVKVTYKIEPESNLP